MKKLLAVILILAVAVVGCGKKNNPLGPNTNTADKAQPTATPVPVAPGKSTVVVKALVGNQPLSNVSCSVQFTGGTAITANTDSTGTATLVIDAAGNYTATIPSQGDILTSALTGYCDRSKSNTITFQASGGAVSITPTAIQYDFSGGTYKLIMTYTKGASSLNFKGAPTIVNLPASWTATTALPQVADGIGNTITVVIPSGATDNCINLIGRVSAQGGAIKADSNPFIMARNWTEYADIRVSIKNGTANMAGINFEVTDAAATKYNGSTDASGTKTIRVNKVGSYSVHVPAQGLLIANDRSGTVSQAELHDVPIQVGSADLSGTVTMDGAVWGNLPMTITDANGTKTSITTGASNGTYSVHLSSIGSYSVEIPTNSAWGILSTIKTGTIAQNGSASVSFAGTKGSIWISLGAVGYIYLENEVPMTITYVNSGEIKFSTTLSHAPAMPAPGTAILTQTFDTTVLTNNQSTTSRYHAAKGTLTSYNGCTISLSKPGANAFTLTSVAFNVFPDWWVKATFTCSNPNGMHKRDSWENYWDSDQNISFTLTNHNVPAGTAVTAFTVLNMPQSYPNAGWAGSGDSGSNGWKYQAGSLSPVENEASYILSGATAGASYSYGITGTRNPHFGTSRCDDGTYTVYVICGEQSTAQTIAFSY